MDQNYVVFVRSWYDKSGKPCMGRKYYLERGLTYDEALRCCRGYNATHKPGKRSRKAEFTTA